jgi:S1-C subfamily serine protease
MLRKIPLPNINKTFWAKILLVLFFMFSFVNFGHCQSTYDFLTNDEKVNISVYEKITPAIVSIEAQTHNGISSGTGCIIDPSGLILTSMHVVNGSQDIEVTTASGKIYEAKVWSVLKNNSDLAILKINPQEGLSVVSLGDSEQVRVGQKVLTIGNPFGFRGTFTTGIVSRIDYTRN